MARGGKREGAGRPKGTNNALPYGAVKAVKSLRHRVPEGTAKPLAELADRALARVADVLEGQVLPSQAASVLGAARLIREEVCGPIAQRVQHAGDAGAPVQITIQRTVRGEG